MTKYSERHGGPYDRGSADSYYRRGREPHYYASGTGTSQRIEEKDMSEDEVAAYLAGYAYNESCGDYKDWGRD